MRVGIYFNKKYFSDESKILDRIYGAFPENDCKTVRSKEEIEGLDVLFTLGGDGTILSVAPECARHGVLIIGVNYGHLGFLAEFEPDKIDEAIALVKSGRYIVRRRSMLEICYADEKFYALNDLTLQRATCGDNFRNTVHIHAEIDGTTVDNFSSDGIIVSTPTGSTAYSLAAGGSVLTPDIEAFIMTPICAHSLHSRPVVFSDKSVLTLNSVNTKYPLGVIVDGKAVGSLKSGEKVTVKRAEESVGFITTDDENFLINF